MKEYPLVFRGGTACGVRPRSADSRDRGGMFPSWPARAAASEVSQVRCLGATVARQPEMRYPRLSRLEEDLRAAVKALDLGGRVRVSFPPAYEGDEVTVEIRARSVKELSDSLARLRQRLDDGALQQVFDLLDQV